MAHRADARQMLDDRGYSGHLIRGQPPQNLLEEAVVRRIVDSLYWQESCFALNAATLCDRAAELNTIGGTSNSGQKPTEFICLILKMLQLGLEDEIVEEYLQNEDFKYLRALAVFYIRLTSERSEDVYRRLEPYLKDYRKLRRKGNQGYSLTHIDEFVDDLLTKDRVCATSLWKLVPRGQLEDEDKLDEYISPVAYLLEEDEGGDGANGGEESLDGRSDRPMSGSRSRSSSRPHSRHDTPNGMDNHMQDDSDEH